MLEANPTGPLALAAVALALAAVTCDNTPLTTPPAPRSISEPATIVEAEPRQRLPAGDSLIVGICQPDHDRVCVLHEDGRASCASFESGQFEDPLPGVEGAIEFTCSHGGLCFRNNHDLLRCVDEHGSERVVEGMEGPIRSIEDNCAIDEAGQLMCWEDDYIAKPKLLPETTEGEFGELVRVMLVRDGASGCSVNTDGELWCWDYGEYSLPVDLGLPTFYNKHSEAHEYPPRLITNVGPAEQVKRLTLHKHTFCWQGAEGWLCTNLEGEIGPLPNCATHPCTCDFPCMGCTSDNPCPACPGRSRLKCSPGPSLDSVESTGQRSDNGWIVDGVVLYSRMCAVDSAGKVWCMSDNHVPREIVFSDPD
ncbi:hypothetical protein G6O69_06130 [Pseudenhygromyxa sp. WMMC2535]|uniref:hypothetical protein n=1 Tax=Pseudenhygromyxa sp. WMMC2535 TaxID=2712867 RepID=UPI0015963CEA|nr:hypothetical protein [Pseudenhygromyxa sp. WMMC2535]NVB37402.1 hypothetical protein [Pseudenhygromyxa sp. WMMC2535]